MTDKRASVHIYCFYYTFITASLVVVGYMFMSNSCIEASTSDKLNKSTFLLLDLMFYS